MITFKEFIDLPDITDIVISSDNTNGELHEGRKWISGRFERNIGIDQPTHGVGQQHAHVYGRNGKNELVVVNLDGTGSHGTKGRLSDDDAAALRARGFSVPPSNIVEWTVVESQNQFLLG